jgi:hypothetical protein
MENRIKELGMKYDTDKVTHHNYHEIYNIFLKFFYDKVGSILEIGISDGHSLKMWLELFPNSFIYGMDIKKNYTGPRHKVVNRDQSNIKDLNYVKNIITDKNLFFIIDDGSHIPEHQLITFNTLFPSLIEGGIYVIEDIETSYWKRGSIYGYSTEYGFRNKQSIIEIFKDVIDSINSEFAGKQNNQVMHHDKIGSITFFKNCILIVKKSQTERDYKFKHLI